MEQVVKGTIGPYRGREGTDTPVRLGIDSEVVVTELHGKYYETAFRRNLYIVSTPAAGAAIPAYTTAAQAFLIYNPVGSGVNISLCKAWLGYVSGTNIAGHVCYAGTTNVATPGTLTQMNVQSAFMSVALSTGGGAGNKGQYYSPGTLATAFAAGNYLRPFGLSQVVMAATAVNPAWVMADDVDGSIVVPQGGALSIAGNIALGTVAAIGALVEEIPV